MREKCARQTVSWFRIWSYWVCSPFQAASCKGHLDSSSSRQPHSGDIEDYWYIPEPIAKSHGTESIKQRNSQAVTAINQVNENAIYKI